jgi:uncharacterized protein YaaQ
MNISNEKDDQKDLLLLAVVQAQDADGAVRALAALGLSVTTLPSVGGFLGRRNATLLICLPSARQKDAMAALRSTCRQRTEFIAVPLESAPLPLPAPTPVTIGGATVFALELDHFEEI